MTIKRQAKYACPMIGFDGIDNDRG